jgi:hypothetical protein
LLINCCHFLLVSLKKVLSLYPFCIKKSTRILEKSPIVPSYYLSGFRFRKIMEGSCKRVRSFFEKFNQAQVKDIDAFISSNFEKMEIADYDVFV